MDVTGKAKLKYIYIHLLVPHPNAMRRIKVRLIDPCIMVVIVEHLFILFI